jgi:outer membrane protein assembly factor BamE (lipoprotein component of BamABCDE complex)
LPILGFRVTARDVSTQDGLLGVRGIHRQTTTRHSVAAWAALFSFALLLGGCVGETFQRGYVLPEGALEQIPLGASQEQVLLVLGTPSTVATVSGEAFYYISQRADRPISFMQTSITDQRVLAVYFDRNRKVQRLAEYGMKDGKVFDFVSRTTPTSGAENNFLTYIFRTIENRGS